MNFFKSYKMLLLFIFLLIIILLIFQVRGSGGGKIIIDFTDAKKGSANLQLLKNFYSEEEFRTELEKLLITVFGQWSLNFTCKASGSKLYCEGVLSSIFKNKPQFQVINTNVNDEDFVKGLNTNSDTDTYLGFEIPQILHEHEDAGHVGGLLDFDFNGKMACLYLAKLFGCYYFNETHVYVPYFNKFAVYKFAGDTDENTPKINAFHFLTEQHFEQYTKDMHKFITQMDSMSYKRNKYLEKLVLNNFEYINCIDKIADNTTKIYVTNPFIAYFPLSGRLNKDNIIYGQSICGITYKLKIYVENKSVSELEIYFVEENYITYNSETDVKFRGRQYNSLLRKMFNRFMSGKNITLVTRSVNPISDHNLAKIGVKRLPEFQKALDIRKHSEKKTETERDEAYGNAAASNISYTHMQEFKNLQWK